MTVGIDFLQGVDAMAPGLSRAQLPLLEALQADGRYDMRPVRFSVGPPSLLFPIVYGPLPAWLALRSAPLLHITNAWYAHLIPLISKPVIVTCHDLIERENLSSGEQLAKPHRRFHSRATFRGMLQARYIVCDSSAVAQRIASYAPSSADRLRIVYLGISSTFSPGPVDRKVLNSLSVRPPYVLYVGSEQPRKNLDRLASALAIARRHLPQLTFVKVGGHQTLDGRARFLEALRRENLAEHTRILEDVSDPQLVQLYRGAAVTVLPSLREGFGFPPLEAMACGCPAIVSHRDSLPEVTAGDALVVDPLDVREIAQAIEGVVCDPNLCRDLSSRGLARAKRFSWLRAAEQYAALYQSVLGGS